MPWPARLLVLSVPALFAVVSRPAHAGRASACKAPPFSVPTETQRAVDAAIDARVLGAGAGDVKTGVQTHTEYETTTLSQDAAARAWVEYTLCTKLAKKLISQDLHDELLRALIVPAVASPIPAEPPSAVAIEVPPPDPLPEPLTPEQVVGTWQVVSHFEWSTCPAPNDTYGDYAYTWLVGTAPDGSLRVDVEGTTAYPRLTGQLQADRVLLEGVRGGDTPTPAWTFTHASGDESKLFHGVLLDLRLHEGHLSGTRDATLYRPVEPTSIDPPMSGVELVPCQVRFAVDATR